MADRSDNQLYQTHPHKAAQIAERAAAEERLKDLEKKEKGKSSESGASKTAGAK